jgi:AraC family transcriptional regulator
MKLPEQSARVIDYRTANASDPFIPNSPILSSSGWGEFHLELHRQPKFDILEHRHTRIL